VLPAQLGHEVALAPADKDDAYKEDQRAGNSEERASRVTEDAHEPSLTRVGFARPVTASARTNYFFSLGDAENVLELTYNHDGRSYELGTGYGHIAIAVDDLDGTLAAAEGRARHRTRATSVCRESPCHARITPRCRTHGNPPD